MLYRVSRYQHAAFQIVGTDPLPSKDRIGTLNGGLRFSKFHVLGIVMVDSMLVSKRFTSLVSLTS
jgi:hypothetical protein